MHIYAFGSICRGEINIDSDVDLLAIVSGFDDRFNPDTYSICSYRQIEQIWIEGNPFAWHLAIESRLLFSSDGSDFLEAKGNPARYDLCLRDCEKFQALFHDARSSIDLRSTTLTFDLSMIFLAIRNFSTCYSMGVLDKPDFSRHAALRIGDRSLSVPEEVYKILERARILCTRGHGAAITKSEAELAVKHFPAIHQWMSKRMLEVSGHGA